MEWLFAESRSLPKRSIRSPISASLLCSRETVVLAVEYLLAGRQPVGWIPKLRSIRRFGAPDSRPWSFKLEDRLDLHNLPAYIIYKEDEKELKPCADIVMSDRVGDEMSRRGLIALMCYRHRNAVRVRNVQSISNPPTSLSGSWG